MSRSITRLAEEEFAVTGMAPSYAFVLMAVNKEPGIVAGEIAEVMQLDPSTVSRFLEKLERKGLVKRHTEGKFTRVYPLAPGLALEPLIRQAWQNLLKRYNGLLGEEKARDLAGELFEQARKLNLK